MALDHRLLQIFCRHVLNFDHLNHLENDIYYKVRYIQWDQMRNWTALCNVVYCRIRGVKDAILTHNCWEVVHLLKSLKSLPPECISQCVKHPSQIAPQGWSTAQWAWWCWWTWVNAFEYSARNFMLQKPKSWGPWPYRLIRAMAHEYLGTWKGNPYSI